MGRYLFVFVLLLSSCAPASSASEAAIPPAADTPAATSPPALTPTPAPTATAEPPTAVPTETPAGQIFRDDFSERFQPGWEWEGENVRRWEITQDGWLQIAGEDSSLLWEGQQSNVLWRQLPEGDFEITVRVQAAPTADFQQATIYIYEDGENYVALNRGYCSPCGGDAVYMEYKIGGGFGAYKYLTSVTDLYLRLVSIGTEISGWYSLDGTEWSRLGRFGNFFSFTRVGLGVSNVDRQGINADLIGRFDFFEIRRP